MMIKPGYKFLMCSHDKLLEKGWEMENYQYFHDDFPGNVISEDMVAEYEGMILTVTDESVIEKWYHIEDDENAWTWPVATFSPCLQDRSVGHTCEEGMTPIDCWFICKTCGTNLRQIIK